MWVSSSSSSWFALLLSIQLSSTSFYNRPIYSRVIRNGELFNDRRIGALFDFYTELMIALCSFSMSYYALPPSPLRLSFPIADMLASSSCFVCTRFSIYLSLVDSFIFVISSRALGSDGGEILEWNRRKGEGVSCEHGHAVKGWL